MSVFFVDEWFSVTREKDRKRIEKKIRQTLGRQHFFNAQATNNNNNNNNNEKEREKAKKAMYYSYSRHKNEYVFGLQSLF